MTNIPSRKHALLCHQVYNIYQMVHYLSHCSISNMDNLFLCYIVTDGSWCFDDHHIINFGAEKVPIRTITNVANSHLWIGHRNKVFILDVNTLLVTVSLCVKLYDLEVSSLFNSTGSSRHYRKVSVSSKVLLS